MKGGQLEIFLKAQSRGPSVLGLRVGEKHPRVIWAVGYRWASKTVQGNTYTRLAKTQGSSNLYGAKLCSFQGRFPRRSEGRSGVARPGQRRCNDRVSSPPMMRNSSSGDRLAPASHRRTGRDRLTRSQDDRQLAPRDSGIVNAPSNGVASVIIQRPYSTVVVCCEMLLMHGQSLTCARRHGAFHSE